MKAGELILGNIDPDMLKSTFIEQPGHETLGSEIGVSISPEVHLSGLPVGSKVFVMSDIPERQADAMYDSVGMVLGHTTDGKVQAITLSPKSGSRWGLHNAYGEVMSEVPDAMAALDRLFDPKIEFGSIAVLSEATGRLLGASTSATIGEAGCNSHEKQQLSKTLTMSQLLDTYCWQALALMPNSRFLRRNADNSLVYLLPGQQHKNQPPREMRDQRSMLDRIQRLTLPGSMLTGFTPVAVLRGLETAVSSGLFTKKETPINGIAHVIIQNAGRIVA